MQEKIELLKTLSLAFGPSGLEDEVRSIIEKEISPFITDISSDALGNLIAFLPADKQRETAPTLMLCAHMDEVGLMITGYDENGFLRFDEIGGLSEKIVPGRRVTIFARDSKKISGVISVKPTHLQQKDERDSVTPLSEMYIDVGAKSKAEAEATVDIGDCAVFDSDFVIFGENGSKVKCKALDDRLGCAVLINLIKRLSKERVLRNFNIAFCFTTREETGLSGALTVAKRLSPEYAVIVETTAVSDIYGTPSHMRVAELGHGGAISIADRSTVYDRHFVNFCLRYKDELPVQLKEYVSGGNDASHIHRASDGCHVLALSAPTRYLHSPACVSDTRDYYAMEELLYRIVRDFELLQKREV